MTNHQKPDRQNSQPARDGVEGAGVKTFDPREAGFTLQDCGCRADQCEGRTDGTCHHPYLEAAPPQSAPDATRTALTDILALAEHADKYAPQHFADKVIAKCAAALSAPVPPPDGALDRTNKLHTILRRYLPIDATFDALWQEISEVIETNPQTIPEHKEGH